MNKHIMNLIDSSKFMIYLDSIGIDVSDIRKCVISNFSNENLDIFINSYHEKLSPNIYVENLVFKYVNEFLYKEYKDAVIFKGIGKLDIKTMIATSISFVSRPDIELPSSEVTGFKPPHCREGFVTISRFERQFSTDRHSCNDQNKTSLVFEGFIPLEIGMNPLEEISTTEDIWKNKYCYGKHVIQGLCLNFNSIECQCVIWINSQLLELLELRLDNYTNGLRALDKENNVVLKYRYWKDELIGNGSSFVGMNANIPKLEGCDLIIREDYFNKLKDIVPNLFFYTYKL